MAVCREVIQRLEQAQQQRMLSPDEHLLIKILKQRLLGLATVEKTRARQKSRITWLRKGDANIKKIQIMANVRKKKIFIHALQTNESVVRRQVDKQEIVFNRFLNHIGSNVPRRNNLKIGGSGLATCRPVASRSPFH
jgi:hypothetical protein